MTERTGRRILVIDGDEPTQRHYRALLAPSRPAAAAPISYDLDFASTGLQALEKARAALARRRPYAVAFVEMDLPPGIDGLETIARLWAIDPAIQVVICTARAGCSADRITARLGRTDRLLFLHKPFEPAEIALLASGLTAKWEQGRRAHLRLAQLETFAAERTSKLSEEVAERRAAEQRLRHLALHDPLTGLPNRACLLDRLAQCVERRRRDPDYLFAVLFLDLDNFKLINDSLGHDRGDELLVSIARRLGAALRSLDTVHVAQETTARLGGDEFIVLLDGLRKPTDAAAVADRIQEQLSAPFILSGHEVAVSASIGITMADRPYERPEDILRDADTAMYRAKGSGKARHATFDDRLHGEALARLKLENDLRRALDAGQFRLVYEPMIATDPARVVGFESLLRWNHPERGTLAPADFLPAAEEMGLIVPIGEWVLREACRQMREWTDLHAAAADLSVTVNLSRRQLAEPGLVALVERTLRQTGLDGRRLGLEIAESAVAGRGESTLRVLRDLKRLGVQLHVDDFGTGLSSLSCLHTFPIDVLKIDRSFIVNMSAKPQFAALINAVLMLAHNLNIKVIAEGVETSAQLAQLLALGCEYIQGFHVSSTLEPKDAAALIRSGLDWPNRPAAAA